MSGATELILVPAAKPFVAFLFLLAELVDEVPTSSTFTVSTKTLTTSRRIDGVDDDDIELIH